MKLFRKPLFLFALFLLSGLSLPVIADTSVNSLELPLGDITLKPGTTLKLKVLAMKANPGIDINNIELLAIEVLAKSRQGKGTIRLRVGEKLTTWAKVAGTQKGFNHNAIGSYSNIKFRSPGMGKKKVWQLIINGYIKIKSITLHTTQQSTQSVRLQNAYHHLYTQQINENINAHA